MKKTLLTFLMITTLTACGGGSGFESSPSTTPPSDGGDDGGGGTPPTSKIVPLPSAKCEGEQCFPAHYVHTGGGAGQVWSFVPEAHSNFEVMVDLINTDMVNIDPILRANGINTCAQIRDDDILVGDGDYDLMLKEPTMMFTFNGQMYAMEKRITVHFQGIPFLDVEIHCGAGTPVKTVFMYWSDGGDEYHYQYQVDENTGHINLVGGQTSAISKTIFGFKTRANGQFDFVSMMEMSGDYILVASKTDPTNPTSMEYVSYFHQNPPNTDFLDDIDYSTISDMERVCVRDFTTSSPIFSTLPSDCNTATKLAKLTEWTDIVGMNSGTGWTTEYLNALFLPPPADY